MSQGTAIRAGGRLDVERAGVVLDVVEHVGVLRQDLAGARRSSPRSPPPSRQAARCARRPALHRGDGGPRDQRADPGIASRMEHRDAPAARMAQQTEPTRAARRPIQPRASASITRRRSCNSAEKVLWPKRSGEHELPGVVHAAPAQVEGDRGESGPGQTLGERAAITPSP